MINLFQKKKKIDLIIGLNPILPPVYIPETKIYTRENSIEIMQNSL